MWRGIEKRISDNEENDKKNGRKEVPLRRELFELIKASGLLPGDDTQYLVGLKFGEENLFWELRSAATNFYLGVDWRKPLQEAGWFVETRAYNHGSSK